MKNKYLTRLYRHGKITLVVASALLMILTIPLANVSAASQSASTQCKKNTDPSHCEQGFDGETSGKTLSESCGNLQNDNKSNSYPLDACTEGWNAASYTQCNGSGCDLVGKYITPAINLFSVSFGLIAVISIILGAIQYSASEGDPQRASAAKSRITNTIFAVVAYLLLYAFLQFIVPGGVFNRAI